MGQERVIIKHGVHSVWQTTPDGDFEEMPEHRIVLDSEECFGDMHSQGFLEEPIGAFLKANINPILDA